MKKIFLSLLAVLVVQFCFADFLVTNRKTSVKRLPSSQSDVVMQVEEGTHLKLLDDGVQSNGYYHVECNLFSGDAWIYRTFVRRFAGTDEEGSGSITTNTGSTPLVGNVEVRVVDVGAGLCNLIELPDHRYIIYDAGPKSNAIMSQINQFIANGSTIELMVLSHTDADHIGNASDILQNYTVKKVVWSGYDRSMTGAGAPQKTEVLKNLIAQLDQHPLVENINLNKEDSVITPGTKTQFGNVSLTFLCGFGKPLTQWNLSDAAEKINSVSIVMKLEYANKSILFCGDAVGRHGDDTDPNAFIATEKYLVDNSSQFLHSTVIIAPHHGANNGSSTAFISSVLPEKVIFSAGHKFEHPRNDAALRYLHFVGLQNIFRTDRGDDESDPGKPDKEWNNTRINGCKDISGDDDINIELRPNGTYSVNYISENSTCD